MFQIYSDKTDTFKKIPPILDNMSVYRPLRVLTETVQLNKLYKILFSFFFFYLQKMLKPQNASSDVSEVTAASLKREKSRKRSGFASPRMGPLFVRSRATVLRRRQLRTGRRP